MADRPPIFPAEPLAMRVFRNFIRDVARSGSSDAKFLADGFTRVVTDKISLDAAFGVEAAQLRAWATRARDDALRAMRAQHYPATSTRAAADNMAADLRRYRAAGWPHDMRRGSAPPDATALRRDQYALLASHPDAALGERQLFTILRD